MLVVQHLYDKSCTTKMARKVKPLTNTEVKQAKPIDKLYKLSDGLQLRIISLLRNGYIA